MLQLWSSKSIGGVWIHHHLAYLTKKLIGKVTVVSTLLSRRIVFGKFIVLKKNIIKLCMKIDVSERPFGFSMQSLKKSSSINNSNKIFTIRFVAELQVEFQIHSVKQFKCLTWKNSSSRDFWVAFHKSVKYKRIYFRCILSSQGK